MSYYLDHKFLEKISGNFEGYSVKRNSPFLANCRCFICGDSQKSRLKKRGYFFQKEDVILFNCKNCGVTRSIRSILKDSYNHLFQEYLLEQFETNKPAEIKERQPKFEFIPKFLIDNAPLRALKKISTLPDDHKAKRYLIERMIPEGRFSELYYSENFSEWVNSMLPEKLDEKYVEDRVVIPYLNKDGIMTGFNGRSLNPASTKRYIAIMLVDNAPKVFNLHSIDFHVTNHVVEGQIDSFFLPNCMAMAGSDMPWEVLNKHTSVIIYDNEPRNIEINKKIRSVIGKGFKCVIWPNDIKEKDINGMVLSGKMVREIVKRNTFQGIQAQLKFNSWTKT